MSVFEDWNKAPIFQEWGFVPISVVRIIESMTGAKNTKNALRQVSNITRYKKEEIKDFGSSDHFLIGKIVRFKIEFKDCSNKYKIAKAVYVDHPSMI